jgi:Vitamin K-dependent gamma-carboxylase
MNKAWLSSVVRSSLYTPVSIAPLAVFRILFGGAMVIGVVRFMLLGWIHEQYVAPKVHFAYFGFEFVPRIHDALQATSGEWSIYAVFGIMLLSAIGVMLGAWYRAASVAYFLTFTYIELIDKTYYLNHYYFVSLIAFLLCFLPAHAECSLDVMRRPVLRLRTVPRWMIDILRFQIAVVYVYAGIAKMTHEWLFLAMPLRIWLPANDTLPVIGSLMRESWMPYLFAWAGMLYDTTIVAWLLYRRTRIVAYCTVILFHTVTGLMFQIGVFPLVMIALTPVLFPASFHQRCLDALRSMVRAPNIDHHSPAMNGACTSSASPVVTTLLAVFVGFQILFPLRCFLYDGNMLWTEEGYRFGWRVMLMEKAATATLFVREEGSNREGAVLNSEFLNAHQEKQMAMQPDMIVQFAHYLRDEYAARGMKSPSVRAEVYATLNGRPSRLYIDSTLNLAGERETFAPKRWVLPWHDAWGAQDITTSSYNKER